MQEVTVQRCGAAEFALRSVKWVSPPLRGAEPLETVPLVGLSAESFSVF